MRSAGPAVVVVLAALMPLCWGCSSGGLAPVSGQVKVNGQPLAEGTIDFRSPDGSTPTAQAVITQGVYSCEVVPGPKKVVIRGYKVVGQERASKVDPDSPMVDRKEPFLPPKYSSETATELKEEIPPGGKKGLDFNLAAP